MSLFTQLSNADKTCACCNKVAAQYYERYLQDKTQAGRPYVSTRKKHRNNARRCTWRRR